LDPLDPLDCALLTFDLDGNAHAAFDKRADPSEYHRVEMTISIYHLNDPELIRLRKAIIWQTTDYLRKADEAHKLRLQGYVGAASVRRSELQRARATLLPSAAYSKAARVAVVDRAGKSELARALLKV